MFRRLLRLYIGRRWRTFCGLEREEFVALATEALEDLGYEYSLEELETTDGERFMLGAGETGEEIAVESPVPFTIQTVTAKSNPGVGFALKFFSPEEEREEMTSGACVVDLRDIDKTTRPYIARFVQRMFDLSDHPPWKVTHHVGFRLAFLLRWKIRVLWRYWLDVDQESVSNPS